MTRSQIAASLAALLVSAAASAQSMVAAITGTAETGNIVRIENIETNYSREIEVGRNGRFQFRSLPTGTYDVVIREPDGDIVKSQLVTLRVGSTASVKQGPRAPVEANAQRDAAGRDEATRTRGSADDRAVSQPARDVGERPASSPKQP